jgi:hypothetical protein
MSPRLPEGLSPAQELIWYADRAQAHAAAAARHATQALIAALLATAIAVGALVAAWAGG